MGAVLLLALWVQFLQGLECQLCGGGDQEDQLLICDGERHLGPRDRHWQCHPCLCCVRLGHMQWLHLPYDTSVGCDRAWHTYCCGLQGVPLTDEWLCPGKQQQRACMQGHLCMTQHRCLRL
jgi:hypothetical protein